MLKNRLKIDILVIGQYQFPVEGLQANLHNKINKYKKKQLYPRQF